MDSYSVNLTRVNSPGTVRLELKGSILIIHKDNWVSRYSLYVPVEAVDVVESKNRNYRKLWEGIIGLMIAFLLSLPLSLWFIYKSIFVVYDLLWMLPLIVLFLFSLIVGSRGISHFLKLDPVVDIILQYRGHSMKFSLWVKPEVKTTVKNLVAQIYELKKILEAEGYTPLKVCPLWFHSNPYRKALVIGLAVSFVLFCLISLCLVFQWIGMYRYRIEWLYLVLPFPPLLSILSEFLQRTFSWKLPKGFKKARRAFEKENYSSAIFELQQLIKEQPDLVFVRFFLIQVLTEQGEFDMALKQCEEFYFHEPSLATQLKTTIWWMRCIWERMEKPFLNSQNNSGSTKE
ncbi:MAG TPA: hypothetical protein PLX23_09550 [Candidatus Hydrogenedens sp.]|nr:hypothetical protein [Candidatus Hydrogenedens sp.]